MDWRRELERAKHGLPSRVDLSRYGEFRKIELVVPEVLSFRSNYKETAQFLRDLGYSSKNARNRLVVDFTKIRSVSPGALLALAAQLQRWTILRSFKPRALDLEQWDPEITRLLSEMGFFKLLRVSNAPEAPESGGTDRQFLSFRSRCETMGIEARGLREEMGEIADRSIDGQPLFVAITEAMTNTTQHAYPKSNWYRDELRYRWWMTGAIDRSNERLSIIFYDLGVGIPETLTKTHPIELIRDFFQKLNVGNNDAGMIFAAMRMGRSGTELPHRGKGLPQIRRLVDIHTPGTLRIISGKGELQYERQGGETDDQGTYIRKSNDVALEGTLVQWDIQLPERREDQFL
ncbi:MAG: hypothetical protein U9P68_08085 [Pseudomonadota bacterium]|nr:hypothetical protein [Pseudomonadota bacterium]